MSCPICKLGGLAGRAADLGSGRGGSGIGQHVVSDCIVHHLFFPHSYYSPLLFYFTLFSLIKLFLSQQTNFTSIPLPIPPEEEITERRLSEWLCGVSSPAGIKTMSFSSTVDLRPHFEFFFFFQNCGQGLKF